MIGFVWGGQNVVSHFNNRH